MLRSLNINKATGLIALAMSTSLFSVAAEQLQRQVVTVSDTTVWGLPVNEIILKRNGDLMTVGLDMKLEDYRIKGDKVTVFTPVLKNGQDSIELNPVGLYSRIRYIQYLREEEQPIGGDASYSYKYSKRPSLMEYEKSVEYSDWMNGAILYLRKSDYGCCNTILSEECVPLGRWRETIFEPQYIYETNIQAEAVKVREITGRAYVDFPVNKIVIYPDYRNNTYELGKIIATIDSVKNDKDITVNSLHIAGTASPEGPYENNVYLAKNRTIALKNYVQNLYNFPEGFITTSYEPVDWAGLREWLENNNLPHKTEILAIVNSDIEPFARNSKIMKEYPEEYKWLHLNVYPALRHSDYRIEFTIRQFSDIEEIREIIKESPQKLSLNEIYLLANSLEPGSEEYKDVFETAVRLYPNDETANLNAANAALLRNDLEHAARYLEKAGNSDKAQYARGMYLLKQGDYNEALKIFNNLSATMPEASEAAATITDILNLEN